MMKKIPIDDILAGRKSRYSLVIGIAKRAREIANESAKKDEILIETPVNLAIKDFKAHKYELFEPETNG